MSERAKMVIAWMVGNDPDTAATYNRAQSEAAHDAARRWGCSITGLISCGPEFDAPAPPAAPIAQGTDDTTAVMTPFGPMVPPAAPGQPPYPEGNVIGPCVCGSWPGGPCLRCKWIPAPPAPPAAQDQMASTPVRVNSGPSQEGATGSDATPAPGADAELCAKNPQRWTVEDCIQAAAALEAAQAENARQQHDIDALYDSLQAANVALVAAEARAAELGRELAAARSIILQRCPDPMGAIAAIDAARKEGER